MPAVRGFGPHHSVWVSLHVMFKVCEAGTRSNYLQCGEILCCCCFFLSQGPMLKEFQVCLRIWSNWGFLKGNAGNSTSTPEDLKNIECLQFKKYKHLYVLIRKLGQAPFFPQLWVEMQLNPIHWRQNSSGGKGGTDGRTGKKRVKARTHGFLLLASC